MRPARLRAPLGFALSVLLLAGCGGVGSSSTPSAAALRHYLAQIEPLRLGVNRLLEGADPVLAAYREHRIGAGMAAARMGALERTFADYTVRVAAVRPQSSALRALQTEYAGTYVLEDAYLAALISGLRGRDFSGLPDTQASQRASIVRWRTGLTVLAHEAHVALPADLQQAGRGEIAPSPTGS